MSDLFVYYMAKNVLAWQFFPAEPQLFALVGLFTEEVVYPRSYATQTNSGRPTHTHTHTHTTHSFEIIVLKPFRMHRIDSFTDVGLH
jgi:hypothetical protein